MRWNRVLLLSYIVNWSLLGLQVSGVIPFRYSMPAMVATAILGVTVVIRDRDR